MVAFDYALKVIVMVIVLLIIYHVLLTSSNTAKNIKFAGVDKEIQITDRPEDLAKKVKVCSDEKKIILDNVGFEYKEKVKANMFFLMKGVVVAGYIGGNQETGEYTIEISPDTNTKTITSRRFTAPPAKEEDLNSIGLKDEETFVFGFINPDKGCDALAKKGVTLKEFTDSCGWIIMRSFFMTGRVMKCSG
ncbi:MAG: hypothetical protein HYW26_03150 [Candidatus Aenigmarchaeota archaeon]|nr:hypothetical protein [Candidatus Aenigmarchaeota archaeon]